MVVTCWPVLFLRLRYFLSSCNSSAQGKGRSPNQEIWISPSSSGEEERLCSGQPSTLQALISHLDVIYCGLHRENSVYCNRDHNYHRSALSQDLCVCVCACVCLCRGTLVHALMDLFWGHGGYLYQHLHGPLPLSLHLTLFFVSCFYFILFLSTHKNNKKNNKKINKIYHLQK